VSHPFPAPGEIASAILTAFGKDATPEAIYFSRHLRMIVAFCRSGTEGLPQRRVTAVMEPGRRSPRGGNFCKELGSLRLQSGEIVRPRVVSVQTYAAKNENPLDGPSKVARPMIGLPVTPCRRPCYPHTPNAI